MIISIPIKAEEKFIKLCHDAYNADNDNDFKIAVIKAKSYSDAINDICGDNVWGEIIRMADLSFEEGVAICCGVPFRYKSKPLLAHYDQNNLATIVQ